MSLTAAERSTRARIGAYARAAQYDGRQVTAAATVAQLARFDRQVDPDGVLPPEERARRARAALRAHMTTLSLRAQRARRKRKGGLAIETAEDGSGGVRR
jgi:hypothetical protein